MFDHLLLIVSDQPYSINLTLADQCDVLWDVQVVQLSLDYV